MPFAASEPPLPPNRSFAVASEDEPGPSNREQPSVDHVGNRKNVYDDDEFDFLNPSADLSRFDTSRVHRGKREKSNADSWQRDVDVERLRALYSKYDIVDEDESDEEHLSVQGNLANYLFRQLTGLKANVCGDNHQRCLKD